MVYKSDNVTVNLCSTIKLLYLLIEQKRIWLRLDFTSWDDVGCILDDYGQQHRWSLRALALEFCHATQWILSTTWLTLTKDCVLGKTVNINNTDHSFKTGNEQLSPVSQCCWSPPAHPPWALPMWTTMLTLAPIKNDHDLNPNYSMYQ